MTQNRQIVGLFEGAAVRFKWNTSQQVDRDGTVWLGGRAGPVRSVTNLCHEMSHLVEIDDERCGTPGWGLQVAQIKILDRICVDTQTTQCTERECRVAAYQHNLLRWAGVTRTPRYLVGSFTFLPDFLNIFERSDKHRLQWSEARVRDLIDKPEYSIDAFMDEWRRKNRVLMARQRRPQLMNPALP